MNEEQEQAYEAGAVAAREGEPRTADPYIQGTPIDAVSDRVMNLSIHWNRGWEDAREGGSEAAGR
jgi:hypothetical protein